MPVDPKLEEHRYRYLVETHLHEICYEENNTAECNAAHEHVKRARAHGMTEKAIYMRLRNNDWYEDQAEGEDVFRRDAWDRDDEESPDSLVE